MPIYSTINRETIASVATSTGFTSTYIPNTEKRTVYALVQVLGGAIRFCVDGTTPTATKGMKMAAEESAEVWGEGALKDFRAIDDGGAASLEVIYFGMGA